MNNDYATQNLLESLFGKSSYSFKNLNEEEQKALRALGYQVIDWDLALSDGKVTREDLSKRVALYKQLLTMDEEIKNRKPKKKPKFKTGDLVKRKNNEIVFITNCILHNGIFDYIGVVNDGGLRHSTEEEISELIMSTK